MKTNSKIVRDLIKSHILECVTDENGENFDTFKDAANKLNSEFERVANYPYNRQRIPNNQARFVDYLLGLPFSFHFYAGDVAEFLNGLGINEAGKVYDDDKSLSLYHYLIYAEMLKAVK